MGKMGEKSWKFGWGTFEQDIYPWDWDMSYILTFRITRFGWLAVICTRLAKIPRFIRVRFFPLRLSIQTINIIAKVTIQFNC